MKTIKPLVITSVLLFTSASFTYAKDNGAPTSSTSSTCKPYTTTVNGHSVSVNKKCEAIADKIHYCGIIKAHNVPKGLSIVNGKCRIGL